MGYSSTPGVDNVIYTFPLWFIENHLPITIGRYLWNFFRSLLIVAVNAELHFPASNMPSSNRSYLPFVAVLQLPSVLWHCWLVVRKSIRPVKIEWWGAGVVVWSEMQMICTCQPIIPCFIKIQIGLTFLVLAYPGCPGKEAVKRLSLWQYHSTSLQSNTVGARVLVYEVRYCWCMLQTRQQAGPQVLCFNTSLLSLRMLLSNRVPSLFLGRWFLLQKTAAKRHCLQMVLHWQWLVILNQWLLLVTIFLR